MRREFNLASTNPVKTTACAAIFVAPAAMMMFQQYGVFGLGLAGAFVAAGTHLLYKTMNFMPGLRNGPGAHYTDNDPRIEKKRIASEICNEMTDALGMKRIPVDIIDSPKLVAQIMNARTGANPRIILSEKLFDLFDREELRTTLAHEISHAAHNDLDALVPFAIAKDLNLCAASFTLAGAIGQYALSFTGLVPPPSPESFAATIAVGFTAHALLELADNAVSRQQEYCADSNQIVITGNLEASLSGMKKFQDNYIATRGDMSELEQDFLSLFNDHPSYPNRMKNLERTASALNIDPVIAENPSP